MSGVPDPLAWLEQERAQPGGSRVEFQEQLADIDRLLIEVGTILAEQIVPVTVAFLEADTHAASEAIATDITIDERCVQLEDACYVLLARQSPVASDLRRVVAVLRSVADVQRSGDLLRHVAESLTWVHPPSMPSELCETVRQLGTVTGEIFAGAVKAWTRHDGLAANELAKRDDQVDLLQKYLLTDLYTGEQSVEEAVSLALIARYYERIADHGVEMARQMAYVVTGNRVTES
ncbi:MAG: phosphate signaling complex protein PhoU [Egibacteraceae bacterium]